MAELLPAVHRTILAVDVDRFGDHRQTYQEVAVRDAMYESLRQAFKNAGIPWGGCHFEDRGDGVLILAPPEIPKVRFAESVPLELVRALHDHNRTHRADEGIRLRMALHAGEVIFDKHGVLGASINMAFRLLDGRPLKAALAQSPGVLAVIASSWFFDEVVRHSPHSDAAAYRPVRVSAKETSGQAWIALPDHPYPPADMALESREAVGAMTTAARVAAQQHVFVSYVSEDTKIVRQLCSELEGRGVDVWLDKDRLRPGDRWRDRIREAIRGGGFFVACFSQNSARRERTYMREELTLAIEELRLRSADRAWFIPLLLSPCQVPDIVIGTGERLSDLHHVDLSADWRSGIENLTRVLLPNSLRLSKLLDKAEKAVRSGDQAGHLEALIEAAGIAPDDPDVQDSIEAATRLGRHEDALDALGRSAAGDSGSSEAQYRIGCVSWLGGRLDDALTAFGRAIRLDENNLDAHYDRGRLLYSLGLYDEALLCFEHAIALSPANVIPRRAQLRVLMTKGDGERLIGAAGSADAQFGAHADFCEARAFGIIITGRLLHPVSSRGNTTTLRQEVASNLFQAIELDPDNAARVYRAACLFNLCADHANAEIAACKGLRLLPESPSLRLLLAIALENQGRSAETVNHYPMAEPPSEIPEEAQLEDQFPLLDSARHGSAARPDVKRRLSFPIKIWGSAT